MNETSLKSRAIKRANGLSGPFSRRGPAYCPRCELQREATWPWPGWQWMRRAWFVMFGALLLVSPIMIWDMYLMLPSALVVIIAIGPLNSAAKIKPTCLHCGSEVLPPRALQVVPPLPS